MLKEIRFLYNYVMGRDIAGRNLAVFPDDTFLVSYPKSGNTWTRFLIGNLIYENGVDFSSINRLIPDPAALSKRFLKSLPRPRVLKSHEPFDPRYQRVICIVRDPRDVVISKYHFDIKCKFIEESMTLEAYVTRFVSGEASAEFGSWGENVGSWIGARNNSKRLQDESFLLLRYEDMIADPEAELKRVARFMKIDASPERIAKASECSAPDRMRKLEQAQSLLWSTTRNSRQDRPFVRAARSGSWTSQLPDDCVREIESCWGGLMAELGYELRFFGKSRTVSSNSNGELQRQVV